MPSWLPLLNYSTKYNVSLSTLRRRIKAQSIEYKLDQGKYFILDQASMDDGPKRHNTQAPVSMSLPAVAVTSETDTNEVSHPNFVEASVLTSANRLVEELKAAYAKILQEKEEQISQLKDEIVDLRMLVRILEESAKNSRSSSSPSLQSHTGTSEIVSPSADDDFLFSDFQNREV